MALTEGNFQIEGLQAIDRLFNDLPKRVNKDAVWGRFWKKVTVPMLKAAEHNAPVLNPNHQGKMNRSGVTYPANPKLTIARNTLKNSIKFYRTRASREKGVHGGYIGPRVKNKFKKNKGGYFGAFVEYGHRSRDGSMSKPNPFMQKAFAATNKLVLNNGFIDAEKIFVKAVKIDERRLKKHGRLAY